jgi:hypothetical protein
MNDFQEIADLRYALFGQGSALFDVSRQVKPVNNKRREAGASHQQRATMFEINSSSEQNINFNF